MNFTKTCLTVDHQTSEPTTRYTDVYCFDGLAMVKQEPQNDCIQMESVDDSIKVNNIAPIFNSQTKICEIEDIRSIKQESYYNWCELSANPYHPAMKSENDLNVCDGNQDTKLFDRNMSVKTESFQTDDTSNHHMEVFVAIACKDNISSNVSTGMCVGGVYRTDEEQCDEAQQEPLSGLKSTNEIKTEGM